MLQGTVLLSGFGSLAKGATWEIVNGAVLKGTDFSDASKSHLAGAGLSDYTDCQDLCDANAGLCKSFDFVGEKLALGNSESAGISTGDCWFRLDDVWSVSTSGRRNHTSGRLSGGPSPTPSPSPTPTPSPPTPSPPSPAPAGAKNVLFILFDDLRAMHETYGWKQPHLPNADRLAGESLVFDRAYVQQAVCGPSRASLLSGRRPDRTQMWNFVDGPSPGGWRNAPGAEDWNSWPQFFKNNGYYVASAGKMYHSGDPSHGDPPSWNEPECKSGCPFFGQGSCPVAGNGRTGCAVGKDDMKKCTSGEVNCFPDEKSLAKGLEYLRKGANQWKSSGQPFWLGVGFVKPHLPHIFPAEFYNNVPEQDDIDLPPNPNFTLNAPTIARINEGPGKSYDRPGTDDEVRAYRRSYYAAAAYSDSLLGQLMDEVDALGIRDDTLVVLTADHGWGLGEHNHWIKYTNFETDTRVPMFVRAPWKKSAMGLRTEALVEHVDLYPSTAELAGIPVDASVESIDGTSWAHLLDKPSATHKEAVYSQYPRCWNSKHPQDETAFPDMARCSTVDKQDFAYMGYSVRTSTWRYTEWAAWNGAKLKPIWSDSAGVELYDHASDAPHDSKQSFEQFENENVDDAHPSTVADLSQQLRNFFNADMAQAPLLV